MPREGGGGGESVTIFPSSKFVGQFSRHGVGYPSYIANLSDKGKKRGGGEGGIRIQRIGVTRALTPPPPKKKKSFSDPRGGGGLNTPTHPPAYAPDYCQCK